MIEVDKTKINVDIHENIDDMIIDTNLVLASDKETIGEAFKDEDDLAVRDTGQESRGIRQRILLGSVMVKSYF